MPGSGGAPQTALRVVINALGNAMADIELPSR
jgi:hypothetical protein